MDINAVIALAVIGAILGCVLAIANKVLYVEEDHRIEDVTAMLPGANCGGCGFPGCKGFAEALVSGEVHQVSHCVASKADAQQKIVDYLNETPDADGHITKVTI